jgi:hypothetical protein
MNLSINKYRNKLQKIIDYGGSINETKDPKDDLDKEIEDRNMLTQDAP